MSEYEKTILGAYASIVMGQSPESKYYNSDKKGLAFIQGNRTFGIKNPTIDTYTTSITKLGKKDSVIMSVRAPVGDVNMLQEDVCLGRGVCTLSSSDDNNEFLYYLMKNASADLINRETGSVFGSVNKDVLSSLPISLPQRSERDSIGRILSSIDHLILSNSQINDYLVKLTKAISYQYLSVVSESEKKITLESCCNIYNGYSYSGNELIEVSDVALVTIKNFDRNGGFKIEGYKPFRVEKKVKDFQFAELFDLLIACTDLTQGAEVIGNPEMILDDGGYDKLIISMDLVKIEPNKSVIGKFALMALLSAGEYKEYAKSCVNGTTVLHLDKSSIPKYEIPIPNNKEILSDFDSKIKLIYGLRSQLLTQNRKLSEIRNTLLPKLMSGEIDVSKLNLGS